MTDKPDDRLGRMLCDAWSESARKHSPTGETPSAWVGGIVAWEHLTIRERAITSEVAEAMATRCFGCGYTRESCRASWAAPDGGGCSGDWPGLVAERQQIQQRVNAYSVLAESERRRADHAEQERAGLLLTDRARATVDEKKGVRSVSHALSVEPTCDGMVYGFAIDDGKRWIVVVPSLAGVVAVAEQLEDATAKVWQMAQDQHGVMMGIDRSAFLSNAEPESNEPESACGDDNG